MSDKSQKTRKVPLDAISVASRDFLDDVVNAFMVLSPGAKRSDVLDRMRKSLSELIRKEA